jgi:hypothetical protein
VCELSAEAAHRLGFAASRRAQPAEALALASSSSTVTAAANGGAAASVADAADEAEAEATTGEADGEDATGGLAANAPLAVVGWKGKASLSVMVEKAECSQMIDKLVRWVSWRDLEGRRGQGGREGSGTVCDGVESGLPR